MSITDCPDLHTLANTLGKFTGEKKKKRYKETIQTVMVYSSSQELIELKQARTVVSSKLLEEVTSLYRHNLC